jgi:hypothetical protein
MQTPERSSDWSCSWETNELEQLQHGMRPTFQQKMEWLEQITVLVKQRPVTEPAVREAGSVYGRQSESR